MKLLFYFMRLLCLLSTLYLPLFGFAINNNAAFSESGVSGDNLCSKMAKPITLVNKTLRVPVASRQLLIVKVIHNYSGYLFGCQKASNQWQNAFPHPIPVVIGKNGIAIYGTKKEGDQKTPSGLYRLGTAFGAKPRALQFDYRILSSQDKFIDDPLSPEYNSWVNGPTTAKSYEELQKLYKLAIVINYNMDPVIPGNGSAIFLHTWVSPLTPTAGCIALSEENLLIILNWLNRRYQPAILILD